MKECFRLKFKQDNHPSSFVTILVHFVRIQSLNAVLSALADSKKKDGHIPYRDSKLTRILQVS